MSKKRKAALKKRKLKKEKRKERERQNRLISLAKQRWQKTSKNETATT